MEGREGRPEDAHRKGCYMALRHAWQTCETRNHRSARCSKGEEGTTRHLTMRCGGDCPWPKIISNDVGKHFPTGLSHPCHSRPFNLRPETLIARVPCAYLRASNDVHSSPPRHPPKKVEVNRVESEYPNRNSQEIDW